MPVKYDQPFSDKHPLKGGLIVFGQKRPDSSEKSSTPEKNKPQEEPSVSQEEKKHQFQEHLKEHDEEIAEAALNQWKGSPSEKTEDTEDE